MPESARSGVMGAIFLALALAFAACSPSVPSLTRSAKDSIGITGNSGAIPAAPTAAPAAPPAQPPAPGIGSLEDHSDAYQVSGQRMIVYTVQVGLEVQDTDKAVEAITSVVSQYRGYIAATNMARTAKGLMAGTLTVRIPAESLDAAQKQIEAVGMRVLNRGHC